MEFETEFEDGDILWKVWDQDLSGTVQFEQYCTDNVELQLLLLTVKNAKQEAKRISSLPITAVQPGDIVYVDIRYFSTQIYDSDLDLPDKYHIRYVIPVTNTRWAGTNHLHLDAKVELWRATYILNNLFVCLWGCRRELGQRTVEVTAELMKSYPKLLEYVPSPRVREQVRRNIGL